MFSPRSVSVGFFLVAVAVPFAPLACGSSADAPAGTDTDGGAPPVQTTPTSTTTTTAPPTADAAPPGDVTYPIKHVIVVVKENHTFDNYFGSFPGAEGTSTYKTSDGMTHPVPHALDKVDHDMSHAHSAGLIDYDNGKMDGWGLPGSSDTTDQVYGQYQESDIPNYWQYAKHYVLADHFHSEMIGPSFPGHLEVLAAQAGWAIGNPNSLPYWGCDDAADKVISIQDQKTCTEKQIFPCFDIPSIPDILPSGVDWKFYGTEFPIYNEVWSMFNGVKSIRNDGAKWAKVVQYDQFDADIAAKTLPEVTFLVNQDADSEHPKLGYGPVNIGGVCSGENWTVRHLNKLMMSDYWKDSVVLFTMDDFGGWYDHVPPPRQYGCDPKAPYGLGFRLPLIIMSPYAKPGFIFKETAEHASIAHFIEKIFHSTKTLHDIDPAAQDAQANDLLNAFDFKQTPLQPLVLTERTCP